jgi:hypothetical protein
LVPASGTGGGGVYQTTLPPNEYTNTYAVTLPAGATQIVKVDVEFGTSTTGEHTFAGDLQFVLTDPTGGMHNLSSPWGQLVRLQRPVLVLPVGGFGDRHFGHALHRYGQRPNGDYNQFFNTWVDGTNGIFNTPLRFDPDRERQLDADDLRLGRRRRRRARELGAVLRRRRRPDRRTAPPARRRTAASRRSAPRATRAPRSPTPATSTSRTSKARSRA